MSREVDRAGRTRPPPDRRRRRREPARDGRDPDPAVLGRIEPAGARRRARRRRASGVRPRPRSSAASSGSADRRRRRRPRPTTASSGSSPGPSSWRRPSSSRRPDSGPRPSRRSSSCSRSPACSSSSSTTCCRPTRSGPAKFVVEGSVAITVATLLVALTGGAASPFFFAFPLIVGGAALVVSPTITVALTAAAGARLRARGHRRVDARAASGRPPWPSSAINLTALVLLAYVALVIARAQRRARDAAIRLSTVDSLTGLFNRTFFFAAIDREIARSARSGRGFCLLMMDLDELKSINDRLGHFQRRPRPARRRRGHHPGRPPDRHGRPLRRRRVRRPPARDRPDRRVRPGREDPASASATSSLDLPGHRTAAVAVDRGRQLPGRRPDRGRADHQRRRRDVRLEAGRQGPRDRRPDAAAGATRLAGVASPGERHRPPSAVPRPGLLDARHPRRLAHPVARPDADERADLPDRDVRLGRRRGARAGSPPTPGPASPTAGSPTRRRARSARPTRSWPAARPGSPSPRGWAPSMPRSPRCSASGDRVVAPTAIYGSTRAQLLRTFGGFGVRVDMRRHDRPRRGGRRARRGADAGPLRGDDRQPDDRDRRPRRAGRARPSARRDATSSTTPSPRRTSAGRSSSARTSSSSRRRSSSAATATSSRGSPPGPRERIGAVRARPDRHRRDARPARCVPRPARHPDPRHPGPAPRRDRRGTGARGSSVRTAWRGSCIPGLDEPSPARRRAAPVPARRGRRDARLRGRRGPRRPAGRSSTRCGSPS